jgi:hypothetical protein
MLLGSSLPALTPFTNTTANAIMHKALRGCMVT